MVELKVVIGTKDGKSYQKELKGSEGDALLQQRLGQTISGNVLGFSGYEFLITGGSDKSGFPLRKGIQATRKRVLIGEGVGFDGQKRDGKPQKGLLKRRTVCGEMITKDIAQVNLKVLKEGTQPLAPPTEEKKEGQ